jgi:hypothetical protein
MSLVRLPVALPRAMTEQRLDCPIVAVVVAVADLRFPRDYSRLVEPDCCPIVAVPVEPEYCPTVAALVGPDCCPIVAVPVVVEPEYCPMDWRLVVAAGRQHHPMMAAMVYRYPMDWPLAAAEAHRLHPNYSEKRHWAHSSPVVAELVQVGPAFVDSNRQPGLAAVDSSRRLPQADPDAANHWFRSWRAEILSVCSCRCAR